MSNKKKIIISIFSLALCVLVTFAWFNELQNPSGPVLALRFENESAASIADNSLTVQLFTDLDEEEITELTNIREEEDDPDLVLYENFAPSSRRKFRVDITNEGESSARLSMVLTDIICESEELRENIIIGTNGFKGFNANYPAPAVVTRQLSRGMDENGAFTLVDLVEIPPKQVVSIYFYVMFSDTGSANLENLSFSIGTINFLIV